MTLTELLAGDEPILAPGAYDALSARLIEQAGFPLAYIGGLGNEASDLGLPDLGFTSVSELARRAGNIVQAVSTPVVCDADTGFGGPLNVVRTVREFEMQGVAAIHLEDQTFPKRCGVLEGKTVVSPEAFVATLKVALSARRSSDFLIIARSDAKSAEGVDGVMARLQRYERAGADAVMVGDFYSLEEYGRLASAVRVPLIACAADKDHYATQPDYSLAQWRSAGVGVVLHWYLPLFAAMHGVRAALDSLRAHGSTAQLAPMMDGYGDYAAAVDLERWMKAADEH